MAIVQKIQRGLTLTVLVITCAAAVTLLRRFGTLKIPLDLPEGGIEAGSYLLIDWDCRKGRPITQGDLVLCDSSGGVRLARVVDKVDGEGYVVRFCEETPYRQSQCRDKEIRGRVLMVLMRP